MSKVGSMLVRTAAPAALVVSIVEFAEHLRLTPVNSPAEYDEQDLLEEKLTGAIATIDGGQGWLGRALVTQSWRYSFACFPDDDKILLPLPPLQSVTSLKYLDATGTEQTFSSASYRVITDHQPGIILLDADAAWPDTYDAPDAVRITFACGYGAANQVPGAIRSAILLMAANLYENREPVAFVAPFEVPQTVQALLSPFRFYGQV